MRAEFFVLFLLVGLGVYLTRLLPLLAALRREEGEPDESSGALGGALPLVGPSIVVALLVTAVVPQPGQESWPELAKTLVALVPTVFVAVGFKDLGLTVLVGVLAYWLVSAAI